MSEFDLPGAEDLPAWMEALRDRYLRTDTSQFVVTATSMISFCVRVSVWSMSDFIDGYIQQSSGKLIVHYDPGRGIWFATDDDAVRAARALVEANFIAAEKVAPHGVERTQKRLIAGNMAAQLGGETSPEIALEALEVLLLDPTVPVAAVIHYAELVVPDGAVSSQNFRDRMANAPSPVEPIGGDRRRG